MLRISASSATLQSESSMGLQVASAGLKGVRASHFLHTEHVRSVSRAAVFSAQSNVGLSLPSDGGLRRSWHVRPRKASRRAAGLRAEVAEVPTEEVKKAKVRPGEHKGFVEEMRITAMKLHTKDQSKAGEKPQQETPMAKWEPTKEGYIQFLVDSAALYDAMEAIVAKATHPMYAKFRNTGLERTEGLKQDLAWFESQGFAIPAPTEAGLEYARYLTELSEKDPQAFLCHFYNVYFAHSAGGRMIGRKISEMLLEGRELEFYKWQGELSTLLSDVKTSLNEVSSDWTREEKDHCLKETELSFKYSGNVIKILVTPVH